MTVLHRYQGDFRCTKAQTGRAAAADLKEAAAQAILLFTDSAMVKVGANHADDGAPLLVADGIKERLHPPNRVHSCIVVTVYGCSSRC